MVCRQLVVEKLVQFHQLFSQRPARRVRSDLQRLRGTGQPSGAAANTQVHSAGGQGSQDVKILGNLVWAIVLEHDPAGTQPDAAGLGQKVRDQDFWRRAHDPVGTVMLGNPKAMVSPLLRLGRQLDSVLQSVGGGLAGVEGALVQNAKS